MFLRRKKTPIVMKAVNGADMMHRFLLDSQIADSQSLALLLGLTPMEDPDEEAALSTERVVRAALLLPILRTFSQGISYSIVEFFRLHSTGFDELTEEQAETLRDLLDTVTLATAFGSLTQLEEIGLISYEWSDK